MKVWQGQFVLSSLSKAMMDKPKLLHTLLKRNGTKNQMLISQNVLQFLTKFLLLKQPLSPQTSSGKTDILKESIFAQEHLVLFLFLFSCWWSHFGSFLHSNRLKLETNKSGQLLTVMRWYHSIQKLIFEDLQELSMKTWLNQMEKLQWQVH